MGRALSLRLRMNLLFATLLTLALAVNIATLIMGAGARVKAEVGASTRLSTEFVAAALASLRDSPDPRPALENLIASLQNLRHVRIYLLPEGEARPPAALAEDAGAAGEAPPWFARLAHAGLPAARIPVAIGGRRHGHVVIASYPWNEISEVWRDVRNLALGGAALALVVFGLTYAVAGHALAPIGLIGDGLTRLKRGDYAVSIPLCGAPELRGIAARFNDLARALERATAENRLLVRKLISVQDDERRELARELHDEMGPYLFAIRAGALALAGQAEVLEAEALAEGAPAREGGGFDGAAFAAGCRMLIAHVNAVQRLNAGALRRLRPQALGELGASAALRALVGGWRSMGCPLEVSLSLPPGLDAVSDTLALTLYRVVQEGLTNVRRHAGATRAEVTAVFTTGPDGRPAVTLCVRDNGVGLSGGARQGLGLLGMEERVRALGGSVALANAEGGGAALTVSLPLGGSAADGAP